VLLGFATLSPSYVSTNNFFFASLLRAFMRYALRVSLRLFKIIPDDFVR
jgi:hypothetical protein